MRNIQVGDIVRVKDDPHRYVVYDHTGHSRILKSVIDNSSRSDVGVQVEKVTGVEAAQRGDVVKKPNDHTLMKVLEVGFNSFAVSYSYPEYQDQFFDWYTFQEAKDWKIVIKRKKNRKKH